MKLLLLGSGALKIGEAGEFDYSGSQAIKALKEEGHEVILVNPNIATNQTSKGLADKVYFLAVNPFFVEKIIKKERPDGVLLAFGGQTALNCGLELAKMGVFEKYNVKILGTPIETIEKTEDRELFNKELQKLDVLCPRSVACYSKEEGLKAAIEIGFPVMVRAAFALGGKGSGFADDKEELEELLDTAFAYSPQVLIEENLRGWKEIEYEVVRDSADNCITVCNMENFDPLGIHTGESIVIAPSQTLNNAEYHMLRDIAIKVIRALGVIGECNIQYALDPQSREYRVIEVNARLSRSSALASKATGYPLAFIAAKLALGHRLIDLKNSVTQDTSAYFEPALDYVALKIPRWDLDKFQRVSNYISSEMKSVGEVMALGRNFEEVMQKGMRMLQVGFYGFTGNKRLLLDKKDIENELVNPTPRRLLAIYEALRQDWTVERIYELTGIDIWFLEKLNNIVKMEAYIKEAKKLNVETMREAKKLGFSDKQIGDLLNQTELEVRKDRLALNVKPTIRQIDTLAAEYPAQTNYLYMTYHGEHDDNTAISSKKEKKKAMVLGSGAYCIGSSVEFDWCCVNAINTLETAGYGTIMINYNPETVSTDYDICDKLYFEELSLERVLDIYEAEQPEGVVVAMGGQIPNNIALKLENYGVNIIGTKAKDIDRAESRQTFSALLDEIGVAQPAWEELDDRKEAAKFATNVGYPVLVRPSYVLSGAAMSVAHNEDQLMAYLEKACGVSETAVVVSKFEQGAKEIEIDAVANDGKIVIYAISEHVENAGVHSGDATIVLPPQKLYLPTIRKIKEAAKKIAKSLKITGPFNIQFLAKNNEIKVIECNLRSSRSFPFASKVTGYNFIEIAMECMLGIPPKDTHYNTLDIDHVGVKAPQFSFSRLKGADPVMGVEMASTGEVACFGHDVYEAFLKSLLAVGFNWPEKRILVSIGRIEDKAEFLPAAQQLAEMGYELFATEGTADFLLKNEIAVTKVYKANSNQELNILKVIGKREVDLVINIPKHYTPEEITDGYKIRRTAVDSNVSLITNIQVARLLVQAIKRYTRDDLEILDWDQY
ncbi:carbamoyl phosphate synthase large subunit [Candidatus Peregrinibacteria bacterium CG11_big_fil_rev_8_21_14_0_20_41_10]|nr:MAG: carbamoyl phosphate synthase large subunit [Candidatus Peregrinibacteria bacterium CG11_big_fil_rev_8_21_14_0_20_41_10]